MSVLSDLSQDIERVVRETSPSVVAVEHERGQGSGIVIASDGYVVTNSHVVRGAKRLSVRTPSSESTRAELVGDDPASDLAVLKLVMTGLPALPLYGGRRLRVGQLVLAIGNPLRFDRSVSLGVVSAIDRTLPAGRGRPFEGLVQTDAAINPGSSGGPLLDATGVAVGITTAVIPMARGLGFAIPAHTVNWVVPTLMRSGRIDRPLIGIAARGMELPARESAELGQSRGVRVLEIAAGEPAERAGVRQGDVILRANDDEVGSVDDIVRAMVLSGSPELTLELGRGKERVKLSVTPRAERRAA
ncbi:MAG TPA: trypsin-like peptidase domain-containing protein [Polyangiaceae bacterium]